MSLTVEVGLLSGRTATVKADLEERVEALKRQAEIALEVGTGRLVLEAFWMQMHQSSVPGYRLVTHSSYR